MYLLRATLKVVLLTTVFLWGCASSQPEKKSESVFFPEPPAFPRIQYLTSFTASGDIESKKSAFEVFVTGKEKALRRLDKPYGVAVYDGKIYVCDTNATVMVFDLKKRTFSALAGSKGLGKLVQPLNISIDKDGTKYVTDPIRGQVVVFDKDDFYVKAFGLPGEWKPVDAVPHGDRLYVADIQNGEVKVLDKETGNMLKKIGKSNKHEERLALPTNVAFDSEGYLYVSDAGRFQVVMYDRDGHYRGKIGDPGRNPGYFARPKGVAVSRDKKILAVDAAFDNVQIFNTNGQLLLFFGKAGDKPGDLFLPADIHIDYGNIAYFREYIDPQFEPEYLVFVTSQFGERMVNVYGFGKVKNTKYPTEEELLKEVEEKVEKWKEEHPGETGVDAEK